MSLFPRQGSVHSTCCQCVGRGTCVLSPTPACPFASSQALLFQSGLCVSLPLPLSLWSVIDSLPAPSASALGPPPHSFLHSLIRASLNLATTLGSLQDVEVPWSLFACLSSASLSL